MKMIKICQKSAKDFYQKLRLNFKSEQKIVNLNSLIVA